MNTKELEKFDPTKEKLTEMVQRSKEIKATDLEDKTQLEIVRVNRIELKKARVQIEKIGKELRDEANKFSKAVIAKEKELIAIIEPEEDRLKEIEEQAKEIAIKKERMEKIPARRERLEKIGDNVEVTDEELLELDANGFESYYNERVAEKNRKDKEQADKEQAEREAKAKADQEAKQKELEDKEKKLEEERLENEKERTRLQAEKDARDREDKAREEERIKAEQEAERKQEDERRAKEKEEKDLAEAKAKRERAVQYVNWRKSHGYTEETKNEFYEKVEEDKVTLFKKAGEFQLNKI